MRLTSLTTFASKGTNMQPLPIYSLATEKQIVEPVGGWQEHTIYLVRVASFPTNPVHEAYFKVGFIFNGKVGGYSEVWNNSYESPIPFHAIHYLYPLKRLHTDGEHVEQLT
jgi:hypothetical protein